MHSCVSAVLAGEGACLDAHILGFCELRGRRWRMHASGRRRRCMRRRRAVALHAWRDDQASESLAGCHCCVQRHCRTLPQRPRRPFDAAPPSGGLTSPLKSTGTWPHAQARLECGAIDTHAAHSCRHVYADSKGWAIPRVCRSASPPAAPSGSPSPPVP